MGAPDFGMTYMTGTNLIQGMSVSIKQVSISITNACREIEIDLSVGLLIYYHHQAKLISDDDELLVIVGGYGDGVKLSSLEMIGDNPCSVASPMPSLVMSLLMASPWYVGHLTTQTPMTATNMMSATINGLYTPL